jgi:hypothetical protein
VFEEVLDVTPETALSTDCESEVLDWASGAATGIVFDAAFEEAT